MEGITEMEVYFLSGTKKLLATRVTQRRNVILLLWANMLNLPKGDVWLMCT